MTDNPDSFSLVALYPISAGIIMKFTDDGWTGNSFRGGEGILSFTVTSPIPEGYVWYYSGPGASNPYGIWNTISGSFSLSTDADQIFVYVGEEAAPTFIFGLSTNPWVEEGTEITTTNSVLPTQLAVPDINASIFFDIVNNGHYNGIMVGTKISLLNSICKYQNWEYSDTKYYTPNTTSFTIVTNGRSPTIAPTDSSSDSSNKSEFEIFGLAENISIALIIGFIVIFTLFTGLLFWKIDWLKCSKKKSLASMSN